MRAPDGARAFVILIAEIRGVVASLFGYAYITP